MINYLRFLVIAFLLVFSIANADSIPTKHGEFKLTRGKAHLGTVLLNDDTVFSQLRDVDLSLKDLWIGIPHAKQIPDLYLLEVSGIDKQTNKLNYGFVILDLRGDRPALSKVVYLPKRYAWDDNHYVMMIDSGLQFGLYVVDPFYPELNSGKSDRMQFTYRDGKLEENKGPWRGPAKPEKYIEPEHPGPCYNVANVPTCIEEVEQAEAAKHAKQKQKAKPPVSAPKPTR